MNDLTEAIVQEIASLKRRVAQLETHEALPVTPWTAWTPTVTQGVSVAATVSYAKYTQLGKIVLAITTLTLTAAGTSGDMIQIGDLPVVPSANNIIGDGEIIHGGAIYSLTAFCQSGVAVFVGYDVASLFGVTPTIALASGDVLQAHLLYEVS